MRIATMTLRRLLVFGLLAGLLLLGVGGWVHLQRMGFSSKGGWHYIESWSDAFRRLLHL